jgi:hypothetical protein
MRSKRGMSFYISLTFIFVICITGSSPFIYKFFKIISENEDKKGIEILLIVSFLFVFTAFYYVFIILKKVPIIFFFENHFKINNNTYNYTDIINIDTSKKDHFYKWFKSEMSVIQIEFIDGNKLYIYRDMYKNSIEFEKFIYDHKEKLT